MNSRLRERFQLDALVAKCTVASLVATETVLRRSPSTMVVRSGLATVLAAKKPEQRMWQLEKLRSTNRGYQTGYHRNGGITARSNALRRPVERCSLSVWKVCPLPGFKIIIVHIEDHPGRWIHEYGIFVCAISLVYNTPPPPVRT